MGLSFSASKRTRRKHWEHQRENFFLACRLMSPPGMALVSSNVELYCSKNIIIGKMHDLNKYLFLRDGK